MSDLHRELCERIGHDEIILAASTASAAGVVLRCQRCGRERYFEGCVGGSVIERYLRTGPPP